MSEFGFAPTAREQLRRWDAGESIWSIEMGGLGPGYEQAIQVLAIEIVRDNIDKPLPNFEAQDAAIGYAGAWSRWGDETAARIDVRGPDGKYACGGFSGAQVGAAKNLAYQWLKVGPAELCQKPECSDRLIQVSNFFPSVPAETQAGVA